MEIKRIIVFAAQTAVITSVVLFAVNPVSCRINDGGLQMTAGDYASPAIEEYKVTGERELAVCFSEPVTITSAVIIPGEYEAAGDGVDSFLPANPAAAGDGIAVQISYDDSGRKAAVLSGEKLVTGVCYRLFGDVEDKCGNTLTFCIPFSGYNGRIPRLILTELHTGYVSGSDRTEFAEFLALTPGNLSGISMYSANDGDDRAYDFPSAEVKAGEIIVVHLRRKGDRCIDETGESLAVAQGTRTENYVTDTARDLWADNLKACLGDKEDVFIVKNTLSGSIMDALMYAPDGMAEWKKESVKSAAAFVAAAGIWSGGMPSDAASSDGLTATKTLSRTGCLELLRAAGDGTLAAGAVMQKKECWHTTDAKRVSPGAVE